ncbi:MAG: protein phosphatase 2C domain-containing protein [Candidatus Altiarchaeota archaeon]
MIRGKDKARLTTGQPGGEIEDPREFGWGRFFRIFKKRQHPEEERTIVDYLEKSGKVERDRYAVITPDGKLNRMRTGISTRVGERHEFKDKGDEDFALYYRRPDLGSLSIIADGLGESRTAGEDSSIAALSFYEFMRDTMSKPEAARRYVEKNPGGRNVVRVDKMIKDAMRYANDNVAENGKEKGNEKPGTTFTALLLGKTGKAMVAHVGDSRLYLVDENGRAFQITSDQGERSQVWHMMGRVDEDYFRVYDVDRQLASLREEKPGQNIPERYDAKKHTLIVCSDGISNYIAGWNEKGAFDVHRAVQAYRDELKGEDSEDAQAESLSYIIRPHLKNAQGMADALVDAARRASIEITGSSYAKQGEIYGDDMSVIVKRPFLT